jgi:hypothetical protein
MSNIFGNIGRAIKKGVTDTGHFVGKVASNPLVDGAIGLIGGPAAAAAAGGLGRLIAPGGNLGTAAKGAAVGYGAGQVGSLARKLGGGALAAATGGGASSPAPSAGQSVDQIVDFADDGSPIYASDIGGSIPGGFDPTNPASSGGVGWEDALKGAVTGGVRKLGQTLTGQPGGVGLGDLAMGGLAGYQALNAANASKRAGQYNDKAINLAETRWGDAAPLRSAGTARLLNPAKTDLSNVYTDPTNPFARKLRSA